MSKTGLASRMGLAVLSIIITLVLCEVLLRVVWQTQGAVDLAGLTTPDTELGYRFVPNSTKVVDGSMRDFATRVNINSYGFRSPEYDVKPEPGTYRVALFGDSQVFGVGVDTDDMVNARMEELLNQGSGPNCQVLNFGMPATGTIAQGRVLEEFALEWEPDAAVFIVTTGNDISDNVKFTNFLSRGGAPAPPKKKPNAIRRILVNLRLYQFARFRVLPNLPGFLMPSASWFNVVPSTVADWYTNSDLEGDFALMTDAFSDIKETCARHEIDMYIAAVPARVQFVPAIIRFLRETVDPSVLEVVESDWDRPQRMLRSFANDEGIAYIEVLDEFIELAGEQALQLNHPNDGHLNAEGTAQLARLLVEGIREK